MDREAWHAVIHGVTKIRTWLSNWTELNHQKWQGLFEQRRGWTYGTRGLEGQSCIWEEEETRCITEIHLNSEHSIWKQRLKMTDLKARSKMRTNKRFWTSIMKSSTISIRIQLQKRRNLNTSRKNWRNSATSSLSSGTRCKRHARRNAWGFHGDGVPPLGPPLKVRGQPEDKHVSIVP